MEETVIPPLWFDIIGVLILVVGTCSLIANISILVVYKKMFVTHKSRLFNISLISLTASDLGIVSMFPLKIDACFNRRWRTSLTICQMSSFLDGMFAYSQIFILTSIALEKYFIIKSPRTYKPKVKWVVAKLSLVWVLSVLLSGLPTLGFGSKAVLDGIKISCAFNYHDQSFENSAYVLSCVTFGFVVPICTFSFCYTGIFRIAKASLSKMSKSITASQQREANQRRLECKLAKTAAISICCFVCSWAPYAVMALMGTFGNVPAPPLAETIAAIFAKFSSTLNAVIYVYNHPRFKAAVAENKKSGNKMKASVNTIAGIGREKESIDGKLNGKKKSEKKVDVSLNTIDGDGNDKPSSDGQINENGNRKKSVEHKRSHKKIKSTRSAPTS